MTSLPGSTYQRSLQSLRLAQFIGGLSRVLPQPRAIVPYEEHRRLLNLMLQKSHTVLFQANTIFPFDFFPDKLVIDQTKINVIIHSFFYTTHIRSVPISDLLYVEVDTSIFFACLSIKSVGIPDEPIILRHLWRKDAIRARKIIEGLILCHKEKLDLSRFSPEELVQHVEYIGEEIGSIR